MRIVFVTPVYGREALTEIVLSQHCWVHSQLRASGVEATSVVVGNDDNLATAQHLGLYTFRRDNRWLGRKFNDGIEQAYLLGADFIVPIGSDSWIHPDYFHDLPASPTIRSGHLQYVVHQDGDHGVHVWVDYRTMPTGVGPFVFPRELFTHNTRPLDNEIARGCDQSTYRGIRRSNPDLSFDFRDLFPQQYTGFKSPSPNPQVTSYEKILEMHKTTPVNDTAAQLACYPKVFRNAIEDLYAQKGQSWQPYGSS